MGDILVMTMDSNRVTLLFSTVLIAVEAVECLWLEAMVGVLLTEEDVVTRRGSVVEGGPIADVIDSRAIAMRGRCQLVLTVRTPHRPLVRAAYRRTVMGVEGSKISEDLR